MPQENLVKATITYHGLGRTDETINVPEETTFDEILRERDIHPETVLVFVNDDVVPEGTTIPPNADIRILRIISGGDATPRP